MITHKMTKDIRDFTLDAVKAGDITEDKCNQDLMRYAAEFLVLHGDADQCLITLNMVPEAFIAERLKPAMVEDQELAMTMVEFVHHLERTGITQEIVFKRTQNVIGLA